MYFNSKNILTVDDKIFFVENEYFYIKVSQVKFETEFEDAPSLQILTVCARDHN